MVGAPDAIDLFVYGALRMEPVMMNLGLACGLAAALSPSTPGAVNVDVLQSELVARGQVAKRGTAT